MRKLRNSKKGAYFFLIDVFLGIFIFVVSIIIMTSFNVFTPTSSDVQQRITMLSEDLFNTELRDVPLSNQHVREAKKWKNISYYEPLLTIDQYVVVLLNHSQAQNASKLIGNATAWLPKTTGINYTVDNVEVYSREAQTITKDLSTSGISKQKVTMIQPNITTSYDPAFTRIEIWQ